MKSYQKRPINSELLQKQLRKRDLTATEVSIGLGYCANYLTSVMSRKEISSAGCIALESIYGIKYETYSPEEVVPGPKTEEFDYVRLEEAIYKAIVRAFNNEVEK